MPVCAFDVLVLLTVCVLFSRKGNVVLHLCSVYLDVGRRCVVRWIGGIGTADTGDFGDHVAREVASGSIFWPE